MKSKKNEKQNLEKLRGIFFQGGLIFAIGLTLLAFQWRVEHEAPIFAEAIEFSDDEDIIIPITMQDEKIEKTEPKKENTQRLIDEFIKKDKEIDDEKKKEIEVDPNKFVDTTSFDLGSWETIDSSDFKEPAPVMWVAKMPHYKSCAKMNESQRQQCTLEKMYKHFGRVMKITPEIMMLGHGEYIAHVYFEVNRKGKITNVKVQNNVPDAVKKEAIKTVSTLPVMIAGSNQGKKATVQYSIPLKFIVK